MAQRRRLGFWRSEREPSLQTDTGGAMTEALAKEKQSTEGTAKIVYVLYLVSIIFGVTGLIGVVIAYVNRGEASPWLQSHYQFQIRTFWIGLVYLLVGGVLTSVFIGYLVLLFWLVWLIVRCVKGIKYLDKREAYPEPVGWMF